ncbi:MAG: hypothetical protein WA324_05350 [Bryobacteraceae bacterium]
MVSKKHRSAGGPTALTAGFRRLTAYPRRALATLLAGLFSIPLALYPSTDFDDKQSTESAAIIQSYLQANQSHEDALRGMSMEVSINASIPGWKKQATLTALRSISKVGRITYHVLKSQGDNTVKNEVIARYLTAEQQAQGDNAMAITPENYKFKYNGKKTDREKNVYVFELAPRKKRVGLFKGEMWLDAKSYLPVFEKGRLVKNPSIFFKKVEFERSFVIRDGVSVPESMKSTINARFVGKVELTINYSSPPPEATAASDADSRAVVVSDLIH